MFETVEIGSKIKKRDYQERLAPLRVDLINAQYELRKAGFSVLVMLVGDDRFGASEVLKRLHEWLDARYVDTSVFVERTPEERARPLFWTTWQALAPEGRIAIAYGGWTLRTLAQVADGDVDERAFENALGHLRRLEEQIAAEDVLVLKFWIHLPTKAYRKRLEDGRDGKADPGPAVEEADWRICERRDELLPLAERLIRETDTEHARWHLVEGTQDRHRDLTVAETIRDAIVARLAAEPAKPLPPATPSATAPGQRGPTVLDAVDLTLEVGEKAYEKRLAELQASIAKRTLAAREAGRSTVLVFEGWDAAGKGGAIRRLTHAMAPRDYTVVAIGAPSAEERRYPYMWRFWRRLPRAGHVMIFDRSWYGRVLVERVEGFATPAEWGRAYEEITDFEAQLVESGMLLEKFWLHVSEEEQLARFEARSKTPYKKYKLTEEDYRNRDKWGLYVQAVDEMVRRTSTELVPWTLVPANDKRYARLQILETVDAGLKRLLR